MLKNLAVICQLILICSCGLGSNIATARSLPVVKDTVSFDVIGDKDFGVVVIKDTIDLKNRLCIIPSGITLSFKGGIIKNGALVGNMTKLKSSQPCFDCVRILGTWNVPIVKSTYFRDLSYDNALKDVVAMANPKVKNTVIIDEGVYHVTAMENSDACIPLCSNTDVILYGKIILTPNAYTNYYIIKIQGDNINLRGNATLEGDKHTHLGKVGEWGMGINIDHSNNVTVSGLTIKDCWGDCIYVGGKSGDVSIEKCSLDHGRRQGISITSAKRVTIKDCSISNVAGTLPEYAIDIEPNKGNNIDKVVIANVTVSNCKGGFCAYGTAKESRIGRIVIKGCYVSSQEKMTIAMEECEDVLIEKNTLIRKNDHRVMACEHIGKIIIKNNKLQSRKKDVTKSRLGRITTFYSKLSLIENNEELLLE